MVRNRSEIDKKYKWDVESIYTGEKIDKEIKNAEEMIKELKEFEGRLQNKQDLLEFLEYYSRCSRKINKLYKYASMKSDQDTRNKDAQGLKNRIKSLNSEIKEKTSFKTNEIQQIGTEEVKKMIEDSEDLQKYDYYLKEILRMKPYTLSKEVEETVSSLSEVLDTPSETYSILSNADIKFPKLEKDGEEIQITQSNFPKLMKKSDREFRKEVYQSYYGTLGSYDNTIGTTFSKNILTNVKLAEMKGYNSARHAALYPSKIPTKVYDSLVEAVENNLEPLHEHLRLKSESRDIDNLKMHDTSIPIPTSEEPEIEFEEAKEHVIAAVEPLGEEYQEKVREAFEERWIDVYETKGKRSGAYSGGSYDTKPYILMNYQKDISSMYTLIHELGHSMHSYLTNNNQPYLHSDYGIFVAEVVSKVNEQLLTKHLLETIEDKEFRKHVISYTLENYRGTLYTQTMWADFEHKVHKEVENGDVITSKEANNIYADIKSEYYKPVEMDELVEREWMRVPHFYYNFYVFKYATGLAAATELSEQIIEKGPSRYLEFLKKGGSDHPLQLLKDAGVDLTSKEPVERTIEDYREYIEKMKDEL